MSTTVEYSPAVAAESLATTVPAFRRQLARHGVEGPNGLLTLDGVVARKHRRGLRIRLARRWTVGGRLVPWFSPRDMADKLGESHASLSKRLQPNGKAAKPFLRLTVQGHKLVARVFGGRWKLRFDDLGQERAP